MKAFFFSWWFDVVIAGRHDCGEQQILNRSLSMDEASEYLTVCPHINVLLVQPNLKQAVGITTLSFQKADFTQDTEGFVVHGGMKFMEFAY